MNLQAAVLSFLLEKADDREQKQQPASQDEGYVVSTDAAALLAQQDESLWQSWKQTDRFLSL